jgi:hypothetical protein
MHGSYSFREDIEYELDTSLLYLEWVVSSNIATIAVVIPAIANGV